MTYCVAAVVEAGIVFASDSRTNAGIDHVAVFGKMNVYEAPGERVVVLLTAGNLGTTQSVVSLLRQRARREDGSAVEDGVLGLRSMYDVACLVGETLREVRRRDHDSLEKNGVTGDCDFLLGGQIRGEAPRLFHVYPAGNFIESGRDTNYFQIGEVKYGKPIIDRVVKFPTSLDEAAKCLLVSFDSTMRSNLSVGPPIDLLAYEVDSLRVTRRRRFGEGDDYFREISQLWSAGLRRAFAGIPEIPWR